MKFLQEGNPLDHRCEEWTPSKYLRETARA